MDVDFYSSHAREMSEIADKIFEMKLEKLQYDLMRKDEYEACEIIRSLLSDKNKLKNSEWVEYHQQRLKDAGYELHVQQTHPNFHFGEGEAKTTLEMKLKLIKNISEV